MSSNSKATDQKKASRKVAELADDDPKILDKIAGERMLQPADLYGVEFTSAPNPEHYALGDRLYENAKTDHVVVYRSTDPRRLADGLTKHAIVREDDGAQVWRMP